MKHLLITLITLLASYAYASNGSGTMGIVAALDPSKIDFQSQDVVKFIGITPDQNIEVLQAFKDFDGQIAVEKYQLQPLSVPEALKKAIKASAANSSWELVEIPRDQKTSAFHD